MYRLKLLETTLSELAASKIDTSHLEKMFQFRIFHCCFYYVFMMVLFCLAGRIMTKIIRIP